MLVARITRVSEQSRATLLRAAGGIIMRQSGVTNIILFYLNTEHYPGRGHGQNVKQSAWGGVKLQSSSVSAIKQQERALVLANKWFFIVAPFP